MGSATVARVGAGATGRRWAAIAVWMVTGAVTSLTAVRLLGVDRGVLLVQAVAFTPYLVLCALAALAVALWRRLWWPAGIVGLTAVVLLALVVPRAIGRPSHTTGPGLTVMSVNLLVGTADAPSIVETVRAHGVDVLAVQELTGPAEAALDAAGLAGPLPYRESHPEPGASGSAVYARFPLTEGGGRASGPGGHGQASAVVHPPGAAAIRIESVHPLPPRDGDHVDIWTAGLRAQLPADPDGPILAGDFNATLDHTELRRLLGTGYRDAASEVGDALIPTWPFHGPRSWFTPGVAIDHVLVPAGVGVRGFTVVPIPNTDHRAIVATLVLPAS